MLWKNLHFFPAVTTCGLPWHQLVHFFWKHFFPKIKILLNEIVYRQSWYYQKLFLWDLLNVYSVSLQNCPSFCPWCICAIIPALSRHIRLTHCACIYQYIMYAGRVMSQKHWFYGICHPEMSDIWTVYPTYFSISYMRDSCTYGIDTPHSSCPSLSVTIRTTLAAPQSKMLLIWGTQLVCSTLVSYSDWCESEKPFKVYEVFHSVRMKKLCPEFVN